MDFRALWSILKKYFITGLLVLVPFFLTIFIIHWLFMKMDSILKGLFHRFLDKFDISYLPGMGFISVVLIILFAGIIAKNYLGKRFLSFGEKLVKRIPLISKIYIAFQQISKAFLSEEREIFKKAVLIEYPRKGMFCIAFYTQDTKGEIQEKLAQDMVGVFLPTTPNPTSGFLLFVPKSEIIDLSMSVEDALKLVISGGAIVLEKEVHSLIDQQTTNVA